ncbi:hypothetical protein GGS21DRAFT_540731 [Xylaria nigripes]|nr:hypothetical protein GGS21DRAFT_540731 [Xylaria nigripes]
MDPKACELWKAHLLSIDYSDSSYKTDEGWLGAPVIFFDRYTLYRISRQRTAARMSEPDSQSADNPVDQKLIRTHNDDPGGDRLMPERAYLMAHMAPNETSEDKPFDRWEEVDFLPTEPYQDDRGKGEYTHGIKLNALLARVPFSRPGRATSADGKPFPMGDPHPSHELGLPHHDIVVAREQARLNLQSEVASELNGTRKVVATVMDLNEHDPAWQRENNFIEQLVDGIPYDLVRTCEQGEENSGAPPSPPSPPSPSSPSSPPQVEYFSETAKQAVEELPDIILTVFHTGAMPEGLDGHVMLPILADKLDEAGFMKVVSMGEPGLTNRDFRPSEIKRIASAVPDLLAMTPATKDLTPYEVAEVQKRIERILLARAIAEQMDPGTFSIPKMKRRYKCWSVSYDYHMNSSYVKSEEYENCPSAEATRPIDMYMWGPIEVASPLFRTADSEPTWASLGTVCDVLKYHFRTHHSAMPTLDMTTSIFIGHTEGYTLLELKKLVTLWLAVEPKLGFLHRYRRSSPWGSWPCRSLRQHSRLGVLVSQPLNAPLNDPHGIMPHQCEETREFYTTQMYEHFNALKIFNGASDADELFLRAVWQYNSVSALSRAMEPAQPPERMSLAIRCEGTGPRTSHRHPPTDNSLRVEGYDQPFLGKVDPYRGVLEFRQMGQCLDANRIRAWTNVCSKVVMAVRETNHVAFSELMRMALHENIPIWKLLGVDRPARNYFMNHSTNDRRGYLIPKNDSTVDYGFPFYRTGREKEVSKSPSIEDDIN